MRLLPALVQPVSAVLSECGLYRYRLDRPDLDRLGYPTSRSGRVVFVMLNPSTADAELDDPTIRRCLGFARDWGYRSLTVVNVFALRSTDPRALVDHPDPVGPDNDRYVREAVEGASEVVAAWGASYPRALGDDVARVAELLPAWTSCLGLTKSYEPRHPLYVRREQQPVPLRGPRAVSK